MKDNVIHAGGGPPNADTGEANDRRGGGNVRP